jgi:hypothetical protein
VRDFDGTVRTQRVQPPRLAAVVEAAGAALGDHDAVDDEAGVGDRERLALALDRRLDAIDLALRVAHDGDAERPRRSAIPCDRLEVLIAALEVETARAGEALNPPGGDAGRDRDVRIDAVDEGPLLQKRDRFLVEGVEGVEIFGARGEWLPAAPLAVLATRAADDADGDRRRLRLRVDHVGDLLGHA